MGWKIIVAVLALSNSAFAQNVENGERRGLLEVSGSIYPTFSLNNGSILNVVGGHFAYQFDEHYSFRGDAFVSTSTQKGTPLYNDFTLIQGGFVRNFTWNRFDLFSGLGLGLAAVQTVRHYDGNVPQNVEISPRYYQANLDVMIGFKFHVSNYFYFYGEAHNWLMHHPEEDGTLGNIAVTGGLGLQLPSKKVISK